MATNFKLLVLERNKPDREVVKKATRGFLPGLLRERVADVLLGKATLPAPIAESEKEADIRRVKSVLENAGYSVCVVEDSTLAVSFERTAETGRRVLGLFPEFLKTLRDTFSPRRRREARMAREEKGEVRSWMPSWMPTHIRGGWAIAVPLVIMVAIGGVWLLFTTTVEGTGGSGGDLELPDWDGKSVRSIEPGVIWAGFAFAFGSITGWTLVPFLADRKPGKRKGFILILGALAGIMLVFLLSAIAPWRWMSGGGGDGGGGPQASGGTGGEYKPPDGDQTLDMSPPPGGPPGAPVDEDGFVGFVHGLAGPESACAPELTPFFALLCELRAMGPPPEGFSPNEPDALADLLTDSFEAMGDDDSAEGPGDDDSAEGPGDDDTAMPDALAEADGTGEAGDGTPGDRASGEPSERDEERDEPSAPQSADEPSAPSPGSGGGSGGGFGAGGGGGGGGSGGASSQEALDEEDRIEEDDPAASPTRNMFQGENAQKDTSIPKDYTKEGLRKKKKDDEASGKLSEESTPSQTGHQARGVLALIFGLIAGGSLGVARRWRDNR